MTTGDLSALGQLVTPEAEVPESVGAQVELVFLRHFLHALSQSEEAGREKEGASYLSLLGDHLAQEIMKGGGLGISRQLVGDEAET